MPIYEYECCSCHCRFERRQRFDEEPIGLCPQCQGQVRRVIHSVPVVFKGSGFYTTDHPGNPGRGHTRKKEAVEEKGESEPREKAIEGAATTGK